MPLKLHLRHCRPKPKLCAIILGIGMVSPLIAQSGGSVVDIDTPVNQQTYSGVQVLGGWAIDGAARIAIVSVSFDGAVYSESNYSVPRQDVCDDVTPFSVH